MATHQGAREGVKLSVGGRGELVAAAAPDLTQEKTEGEAKQEGAQG